MYWFSAQEPEREEGEGRVEAVLIQVIKPIKLYVLHADQCLANSLNSLSVDRVYILAPKEAHQIAKRDNHHQTSFLYIDVS